MIVAGFRWFRMVSGGFGWLAVLVATVTIVVHCE